MILDMLKYDIFMKEKKYTSKLDFSGSTLTDVAEGLEIKFNYSNNIMKIELTNNSLENIILNELQLRLFSFQLQNKVTCTANSDNFKEEIASKELLKADIDRDIYSHLFTVVEDKENKNNYLVGFTASHSSKNLVKVSKDGSKVVVAAIYNFISESLKPGESLVLDLIYVEEGANYFKLLKSYTDIILLEHPYEINDVEKNALNLKLTKENLFFEKSPSDFSLRKNGNPLESKLGYPIDICKDEGKKRIIEKALALSNDSLNIISLTDISTYLVEAEKVKSFNVYHEIHNLMCSIKNEIKGVKFYFDQCPMGILIGNNAVIDHELKFKEKKGALDLLKIKKRSKSLDYNFLIKLMLQRLLIRCSTSFSVEDPKLKELLQVITGNGHAAFIKNKELQEIIEDIDFNSTIIPHVEKDDIYGFLINGKKNVYLAIFNSSSSAVKLFYDLTVFNSSLTLDGVMQEVIRNSSYLISDSKIYIRNFPQKDYFLFKKPILG